MKGRTAVVLLVVFFTSSLISNIALHKAASIQIGSAGEDSVETWSFNFTLRLPAAYICANCLNISYLHPDHDPPPPSVCVDFDPEQIPELSELAGNLFPIVPIGDEPLEIEVTRTGDAISASFEFTHNYTGHLITADLSGSIVGDQVSFTITYHLPVGLQSYSMPLSHCDIMREMEGSVNYTLPAELTGFYHGALRGNRIDGAFNCNVVDEFAVWRFHCKYYVVRIDPFTGIQTRDYLWLDAIAEWRFSNLRTRGYFTVNGTVGDLLVSSIKCIQVVQDPEALVRDKRTVICAYVESSFEERVWTEIEVTYDYDTKFYVETGPSGNGTPLDPGVNRIYIPGGPAFPVCPEPWIANDTPPWLIWTNVGMDNAIKVKIDPYGNVAETNEGNNEKLTEMRVVESDDLRILCIPVHFPELLQEPLSPQMDREVEFMKATYPISEDNLQWRQRPSWPWPGSPPIPTDPKDQTQQIVLEDWLYRNVALPISIVTKMLGYDRVVIVLHDMKQNWWGKSFMLRSGNENSTELHHIPVLVTNGASMEVVAHEIGHTYYLWHPHDEDLGPPVYTCKKYWVARREYEELSRTFMGHPRYPPPEMSVQYWETLPVWIDKGRYDNDMKEWMPLYRTWRWNLFDQLTISSDEVMQVRTQPTETVMVWGLIFSNGTLRADEAWYTTSESTLDLVTSDSGDYSVVLLDDQDQVLSEYAFNASFTYFVDLNGSLTEAHTDVTPFSINVPLHVNTHTIQIRNATGHVLSTRVVSSNAPAIDVVFPNGGEVLTKGHNYTVSWVGSDLDGDDLTYIVVYSPDDGENWIPLTINLKENSYLWNISDIELGTDYLFRIIATDGVNTSEDVSDGSCQVIPEFPSLLVLLLFMMLTLLTTVAYRRKHPK